MSNWHGYRSEIFPAATYARDYYFITRELPGVALMNISNEQIYMGNGNTFIY